MARMSKPRQETVLSHEDALRLNVLMAGEVHAVRIDEGAMTLHALTPKGEAKVVLNPDCGNDAYLRKVREFLAGRVLDSPGGYPVYLRRWTRMGQARQQGLDKLLLLGEPEAVVSVAYSPGVTDELARRAWWALPISDNARRMLERSAVAEGEMGPVLARFLVDHLPFEDDPWTIIDTIRTVLLRPGLIDDQARLALWRSGRHRKTYRVGFLACQPDHLPESGAARADLTQLEEQLAGLDDNRWAVALRRLASASGQTFLTTVTDVLESAADQEVVNEVLDALADYFRPLRPESDHPGGVEAVRAEYAAPLEADTAPLLEGLPAYEAQLRAMRLLSRADRRIADEILSRTTAVGSLMRRKLDPVTQLLQEQTERLRQPG